MSFSGGIRKGGGFLNDVAIKVVGYEFTNKAPGSGTASAWVYFVLKYTQADSDAPQTHSMFVGSLEDYVISEDGQSLLSPDGGNVVFNGKTRFGRFITTLLEKGFPEASLPDLTAGAPLSLTAIIGYRLNMIQEVDVKGTAKRGKRKDPKTGKEYDRTNSVVGAVLGKANGAAPASTSSTDVAGSARTVLAEILAASGGTLPKAQLQMKLFQKLGPTSPVVKYLADEKNIAALDGVTIDLSTPARTIALAQVTA